MGSTHATPGRCDGTRIRRIDIGLAVLFTAIGVAAFVHHADQEPATPDVTAFTVTLVALISLPIALRRRAPIPMLIVTTSASVIAAALLIRGAQFPSMVLCLYIVASR